LDCVVKVTRNVIRPCVVTLNLTKNKKFQPTEKGCTLLTEIAGLILSPAILNPPRVLGNILFNIRFILKNATALRTNVTNLSESLPLLESLFELLQKIALSTTILSKNHVLLGESKKGEAINAV